MWGGLKPRYHEDTRAPLKPSDDRVKDPGLPGKFPCYGKGIGKEQWPAHLAIQDMSDSEKGDSSTSEHGKPREARKIMENFAEKMFLQASEDPWLKLRF